MFVLVGSFYHRQRNRLGNVRIAFQLTYHDMSHLIFKIKKKKKTLLKVTKQKMEMRFN